MFHNNISHFSRFHSHYRRTERTRFIQSSQNLITNLPLGTFNFFRIDIIINPVMPFYREIRMNKLDPGINIIQY